MLFPEPPLDELLDEVAARLSPERDKAVKARAESGLEEIWQKARRQYQGLDDANSVDPGKPRTLDGPLQTTMRDQARETKSTVFVNITRPYTNAGTAKVADILLPTSGKKNWGLKPTPVSDVEILRQAIVSYPELTSIMPEPLMELLSQTDEDVDAAMAEAETWIDDWLTESKWHSNVRKQIIEAGKVGTGIIKGPFSKLRKLRPDVKVLLDSIPQAFPEPEATVVRKRLEQRLLYKPGHETIPVENCFPDMPGCGDDIQNGRFFWEKVPQVTATQLQDLLEDPNYFASQIYRCLEEKPIWTKQEARGKKDKDSYDIWRRQGTFDLGKLDGTGVKNYVFVELELCNDHLIKVVVPPLDDTRFTYWPMLWESRQNSWAGIGIPEQIETPQRGLNASARAGNDNMGWSVGFQLIFGKGIEPFDGEDWTPTAYKKWKDVTDAIAGLTGQQREAKDAIGTIEFPNYLDKILAWIEFWLQMAESTTGLPLLFQGQKSSDSVGVSQALGNNATTNLRMLIKHWDDETCAPLVQLHYQWVQQYGPESAKGDAVAMPLGSSTLIVRDLQQQSLLQIIDRVVQPIFRKSPAKLMDMFLEGLQFDPRELEMSEEELQQLQAAQEEPEAPVQVAQIRTQSEEAIAKMEDVRKRWEAMLDAQLKGMSIQQAEDAVETQAAGNIALEAVKQDAPQEPQKTQKSQKSQELPDIDESLKLLGAA